MKNKIICKALSKRLVNELSRLWSEVLLHINTIVLMLQRIILVATSSYIVMNFDVCNRLTTIRG